MCSPVGDDTLATADALERLQDGLTAGSVTLEQGLALATGLGDTDEQVLGVQTYSSPRRLASSSASSITRRERSFTCGGSRANPTPQ